MAANLELLWFEQWDNVTIDVPNEPITLAAWVMEHDPSQPWVIIVHGIRSCKANHEVLIPAAWLHDAGFNVILFDMRDHGDSTTEDGLVSAGQREYRDFLAVWQWIQDEKGTQPENIGAVGISMGAGAVTIAFRTGASAPINFPRIALLVDGHHHSRRIEFAGFPPFLKDAAIFAGKVSSGDDLVKYEPINAMAEVENRSVFITQSLEDVRINIHHGESMCEAAQEGVNEDGIVDCWFASSGVAHNDRDREGVLSHITLMLTQPDEYRPNGCVLWNRHRHAGCGGLKRGRLTATCGEHHGRHQPAPVARPREERATNPRPGQGARATRRGPRRSSNPGMPVNPLRFTPRPKCWLMVRPAVLSP